MDAISVFIGNSESRAILNVFRDKKTNEATEWPIFFQRQPAHKDKNVPSRPQHYMLKMLHTILVYFPEEIWTQFRFFRDNFGFFFLRDNFGSYWKLRKSGGANLNVFLRQKEQTKLQNGPYPFRERPAYKDKMYLHVHIGLAQVEPNPFLHVVFFLFAILMRVSSRRPDNHDRGRRLQRRRPTSC